MLDALFRPRSVAVVGASRTPRTIGWQLCDNLIRGGFDGRLFPVNPRHRHVHSIRSWPSVAAIGEPVDLAVLAVPAPRVLDVARDALEGGARGLVVVSAGFGEVDDAGRAREAQLVAMARAHGARLLGPNCMGVVNTDPAVALNATFARTLPTAGNVAFMSQSGALGEAILAYADRLNLGLSMFASVGNRADVSAAELVRYWGEDPRTDVVLLYLESFGDPAAFLPAVREVSRRKPVVAVKAGRSSSGRRAVSSHTGAMLELEMTTDALFAQAGVHRARTVDELFHIGRAFASQPLPKGRRVAVVTNAGGPGALAADAFEAHGLELPTLPDAVQDALTARVLPHSATANPVDLTAAASADHFGPAVELAIGADDVDAVLVIFVPPIVTDSRAVLERIVAAHEAAPDKPVLACLMGEAAAIDGVEVLGSSRIPVYGFPEPVAAALDAMATQGRWRTQPLERPPALDDGTVDRAAAQRLIDAAVARASAAPAGVTQLPPADAAALLDAYGVPVVSSRTVASADDAVAAAEELGFPVVLKAASEHIVHKSDVGGVVLDIRDAAALRGHITRLDAALRPQAPDLAFLLQPFVPGGGVELIAGLVMDPRFGPLVMVGLGGTQAEAFRDVAFRLAPPTARDAEQMLEGLRAKALLGPWRGRGPLDRAGLVEVIVRLGRLAADHPEVVELDVNPLLAFSPGEGAARALVAVDARVAVRVPPTA